MSFPPPPQQGYGAPQPAPSNNMGIAIAAIVVGVLCGGCLGAIPAIVSIVNANKVNGLAATGNLPGAHKAAEDAKKWAIISFVVSAVITVGWVILNVLAAGSSN